MKGKQYLIVGSDNYWYGSCFKSVEEAIKRIEDVRQNMRLYGQSELPEIFYIYEAKEIEQIKISDEENAIAIENLKYI